MIPAKSNQWRNTHRSSPHHRPHHGWDMPRPSTLNDWLVVRGLEHCLFFHGSFIIPSDELIFWRRVETCKKSTRPDTQRRCFFPTAWSGVLTTHQLTKWRQESLEPLRCSAGISFLGWFVVLPGWGVKTGHAGTREFLLENTRGFWVNQRTWGYSKQQ